MTPRHCSSCFSNKSNPSQIIGRWREEFQMRSVIQSDNETNTTNDLFIHLIFK